MKVLIIEDEKYGFDNLCRLLRQIDQEVSIAGPVTNVKDTKQYMHRQQDYDIIFADIKLEDGLCFEALADINLTTPIIFITAYDEYALKAFQSGGIGYLLKPIEKEELGKAVERALQLKWGGQDIYELLQLYGIKTKVNFATRLLVNKLDGASIIQVSEISHIVFDDGKVIAYMNNGSQLTLSEKTLEAVFARLNPDIFFRANRQYVINIDSIKKIHTWFRQTETIELKNYDDLRINISKDRVPIFHAWIEKG